MPPLFMSPFSLNFEERDHSDTVKLEWVNIAKRKKSQLHDLIFFFDLFNRDCHVPQFRTSGDCHVPRFRTSACSEYWQCLQLAWHDGMMVLVFIAVWGGHTFSPLHQITHHMTNFTPSQLHTWLWLRSEGPYTLLWTKNLFQCGLLYD